MKESTRFEKYALITLSVMLVGVFMLSLHMYDDIAEGTTDGVLAVFAEGARNFVCENEAVAAFLGIEENEPPTYEEINIDAEAAAYIDRYNEVFKSIK